MRLFEPRSLQLRLAARLGVLLLVATLLAAGTFFYLSYRTADSLGRRDQFRLADELAESIEKDGSLEPVSQLAARGLLEDDTAFAMRDADGALITASDDATAEIARSRPPAGRRPQFFRLDDFGPAGRVYYGFELKERSEIGPVSVLVAAPDDAENELLNAMLDEIALAAAWIIPLFVGSTLLVGVFAIRGGLRPLRETAAQATRIRPGAMSVRLGTKGLPSAVLPLVDAVNRALDRLEKGFALQRQLTANAAHELRTPLAIVTGALESIEEADRPRGAAAGRRAHESSRRAAAARGAARRRRARCRGGRGSAAMPARSRREHGADRDRAEALAGARRHRAGRHRQWQSPRDSRGAARSRRERAAAHAPRHGSTRSSRRERHRYRLRSGPGHPGRGRRAYLRPLLARPARLGDGRRPRACDRARDHEFARRAGRSHGQPRRRRLFTLRFSD